jgi:hypothetical protein
MNFVIRSMEPGDEAFILNAWLLSGRKFYEFGNRPNYFTAMEPRLKLALQNHEVYVVCNDEEPRQIFAWLCCDSRFHLVHFVYTKQKWRGMGLAQKLLAHTRIEPPFCSTCPTMHRLFTYIGGI